MLVSRTCRALLLALLLAAGLGRAARADDSPTNFGVLNLESLSVPPELANALSDALRRQLGQLSGAAISAQDMVEVKLVFHCVDEKPACLARAGKQLGVGWLVYGKLRPQPADGSTILVELHQLHVGKGIIENSIKEAVPASALAEGNPDLESLAQRWLLILAKPTKKTLAPSFVPPTETRWNRGLWISSAVFGGLASAAALAALGTWRGIGEAQDRANEHLDLLQGRLTSSREIGMYQGFFESSDQLSRCASVPSLQGDPDYESYRSVCQRGNTLATATNGLLAAAGGLAVLSIASLILSRALQKPVTVTARPRSITPTPPRPTLPPPSQPVSTPPKIYIPSDVPDEEPPPAGEPRPSVNTSTLRLDRITPAVGANGASVTLQLSF